MELKQALEKELKVYKFIRLESLHRLITSTSVASHLREDCPNKEILQQIASSAPKLFAILILLEQETAITEYLSKGFCDKDFPILDKAQIPDFVYDENKQALYEKQWCIPIVLHQSQHLDLPTEFKPPFLENSYKNHGSFGSVFKVRVANGHLPHHNSSDSLALKQIRKDGKNEWDGMMREVETLRARRHQYIVPLLASWNDRSMESECLVVNLNLLFPYSNSNLEEWMIRSEGPGEWQNETDSGKRKEYIYDSIMSLCDAVAYLHKEIGGWITSHHDLKPDNILLFGRTWKIADLGRTHLIPVSAGSDTEGASGLGSFIYQPPEYRTSQGIRANTRHGRAFDVWALGCITIEFLTLAVYGWSTQMQHKFREKRRNNQTPRVEIYGTFNDPQFNKDISFHNNIQVVKEWMCQLRKDDGSSNLTRMLEIVDGMLNSDPHTRPLSWEVYLDFYELLKPNNTTSEKALETSDRVQGPSRHHKISEDNPLQRAATKRNTLRVEYLLKAGWSRYPVNTSNLDGEDGEKILNLIKLTKVMKGLRFRRTFKSVEARLMETSLMETSLMETSLMETSLMETSLMETFAKSISPQMLPAVTDHGHIAWEAFKERHELTLVRRLKKFVPKIKEQQDFEEDEQGMTKLHRLCEKNQSWQVMIFLDRRPPDFVGRILTCKDHKGRLPLHYAAEKGSKDLVEFLLDSFNLDPTVLVAFQDSMERTPLHIAADNDRDKLIKPLVSAHKDIAEYLKMRDKGSLTALDLARRRGTEGAKTMLELERVNMAGKQGSI